jgi:hypothetical protein
VRAQVVEISLPLYNDAPLTNTIHPFWVKPECTALDLIAKRFIVDLVIDRMQGEPVITTSECVA